MYIYIWGSIWVRIGMALFADLAGIERHHRFFLFAGLLDRNCAYAMAPGDSPEFQYLTDPDQYARFES
jgi:hypothetical protein